MTLVIIGAVGLGAVGLIVFLVMLIFSGNKKQKPQQAVAKDGKPKDAKELEESYAKMMQQDVYHIFSKEFHEELRNKARLDFQRVINENAMFLQQDLRLTTSEINEYLKKEISTKLEEEFTAYQQSIKDVQQAAVESINSTVTSAHEQQKALAQQIQQDTDARKEQIIANFEANMAEVVNYYILKAVGDQLDLKEQLPYIVRQLQSHREEMKKDMWL